MSRTGRRASLVLPMLFAWSACGGGPATPALPVLEAIVAAGDGQFGPRGGTLDAPLEVLVRAVASQKPQESLAVLWSIEGGDASFVTSAANLTDSAGVARMRLRLGGTVGEVRVRVTVVDQESASAAFTAHSVDTPILTSIVTGGVAATGEAIELAGSGFSTVAEQNVVLFSGIRGRVDAATGGTLTVRVPPCLPSRPVEVTVQLGGLVSLPQPLQITGGGPTEILAPGDFLDLAADDPFACVHLGDDAPAYLMMVYSASTVGVARHDFTITGAANQASTLAAVDRVRPGSPVRSAPADFPARELPVDPQTVWHEQVRLVEREALRGRTVPPADGGPLRLSRPAAIPTIGERRTFSVLNKDRTFDEVSAVARFVGDQVALFVDETAPSGGFTLEDLQEFSRAFDEVIHPAVTEGFGRVSDIDGDERVTILFTPTVNRMTPRGSNGFVGGFFFGVDLVPGAEGSNEREVFYTLVPDPSGALSDRRTVDQLLDGVPAILAHEFQHMVAFNERRLVLGGDFGEATWLSEALAQVAEEVVARAYDARDDAETADTYRVGNRIRARRYLGAPADVSLIFGVGSGTLEERGAGVLFMLYLGSRQGAPIWSELTRTTRVGVDNVSARLGVPWPELLGDWWSAVYLDERGGAGALHFAGVDLPDWLGAAEYPLRPDSVGSTDFSRNGTLWSSSAHYYIVVPSLHGSIALRLGGAGGAASPPGTGLRMRVIRLP